MAINEHATVRFGADTGGFRKKLQEMTGMSRQQVNVLMGVFGAFSLRQIHGQIKQVITSLDDMAKSARAMGQEFNERARLDYIARRMGADINAMDKAVLRMNSALHRGGGESERYAEMLAKIGVSVDDLRKMNPTDQFVSLARAVNAVTDPTERLLLATEMFGARGANVAMRMASEYRKLQADAARYVRTTEDGAKAAEAYQDAITNLGEVLRGALVESGAIEALAKLAIGFAGWAESMANIQRHIPLVEVALTAMLAKIAMTHPWLVALGTMTYTAAEGAKALGEASVQAGGAQMDMAKVVQTLAKANVELSDIYRQLRSDEGMAHGQRQQAIAQLESYLSVVRSLTAEQMEQLAGTGIVSPERIRAIEQMLERMKSLNVQEERAIEQAATKTARDRDAMQALLDELGLRQARMTMTEREIGIADMLKKAELESTQERIAAIGEYLDAMDAVSKSRAFEEVAAGLDRQVAMQELINAGRETEARIMEIQARLGRELTDAEKERLATQLERLNALKAGEEIKERADSMRIDAVEEGTALQRIGGLIGTGMSDALQREGLSLDRRRNGTLESIDRNIRRIEPSWGMA